MNINPNINSSLNYQNTDDITKIEISSKESIFLMQSIDYANTSIQSRNIGITPTDTTKIVELTPSEFTTCLKIGNLPTTTIMVTGNLTFQNNDITYLPSNLIINGKLKIENCNNFTQMPSALTVDSLSIINCNNLIALADDTVINTNLKIKNCAKFRELQQVLTIESLSIINCAEIELSSNITVDKTLLINSCPKITDLPLSYDTAFYITLLNLNNLKLSNDFFTAGSLEIYNCNIDLPEDMVIGEDFILDSCDSVKCLPNDLTVHGDIKILNCIHIVDLPSIWFNGMPDTLPFYTDSDHHFIALENTGISKKSIINYAWNVPHNIIITDDYLFTLSIDELVTLWVCHANSKDEIYLTNISANDQENLRDFLYKLTATTDYLKESTKNYLANRVINILKLINNDDKLRETILLIIHDAISACADRLLLSLAEIEFLPLLQQAEQQSISDKQGTLLQKLGKQQLYADEIQNFAISQAELKEKEAEELEFVLEYKIHLASYFKLNFPKITMNYSWVSELTNDDIESAKQTIETKVTDTYIKQWLNNWKPWQRHKRRWQLKPYNQLKAKRMSMTELQAKGACIISGKSIEETTDLVIYHNNIYSYKSLCKWYILKGTNPLIINDTINLNNIFAVRIDESNEDEFYKKIKLDDNI